MRKYAHIQRVRDGGGERWDYSGHSRPSRKCSSVVSQGQSRYSAISARGIPSRTRQTPGHALFTAFDQPSPACSQLLPAAIPLVSASSSLYTPAPILNIQCRSPRLEVRPTSSAPRLVLITREARAGKTGQTFMLLCIHESVPVEPIIDCRRRTRVGAKVYLGFFLLLQTSSTVGMSLQETAESAQSGHTSHPMVS